MSDSSWKPPETGLGPAAEPPAVWRAGGLEFHFPRAPLIMGILNVTPDSFSDGGLYLNTGAAVEHALQLEAEGADLLDIGGESTRPAAPPVSETEELLRVLPVLEGLAGRLKIPISVDTMKPAVAREALKRGACMVNDIASNRTSPEMWEVVAEAGAGYVLMHMRGVPRTMQIHPSYDDVVATVDAFFGERLARLAERGVRAEQVALDPGIGFGKTLEHNLRLLAGLERFKKWARPLLVGVSRKSFIGLVAGGAGPAERLPGSLAAACWAAQAGAGVLRVHDVAATRQALAVTRAIANG